MPIAPQQIPQTIQTIRIEADRAGVPRQVALAFAWVESRFNPDLQGDLAWHTKQGGALYRRYVLANAKFAQNPARSEPQVWHSYGLFQLLAPFHLQPLEHPHVLLSPRLNAERALAYIAKLLAKSMHDVQSARLAYVGAGFDGKLIGEEHRKLITTRIDVALERFKDG